MHRDRRAEGSMSGAETVDYVQGSVGATDDFIREALRQADPNVLRLALYHETRDPELAAMQVEKREFWGCTYELPAFPEEHHEVIRRKAFDYLTGERKNVVKGKRVSVSCELGGGRNNQKKKNK